MHCVRMDKGFGVAAMDVRPVVEAWLKGAMDVRASDVHVEPVDEGYEVRMRVDGLLRCVERVREEVGRAGVARLMVMGQLLTYRLDVPQEGRVELPGGTDGRKVFGRLAVMPTVHGLRAVVRMPAELVQPRGLEALGLPTDVVAGLKAFAGAETGMLVVTGPAGSGKTTTVYAVLEYLAGRTEGVSIISLEDPVEWTIAGVTQIEVTPFGELTYERALRSILRQDPQVLALGEIRDGATAALAVQAALTGHRLVCTLHAATPGGAIARLLEMGVEPYQVTSSLYGVVNQRLLRKRKHEGGYAGRVAVAELARLEEAGRAAVLRHADAATLEGIFAQTSGAVRLRAAADKLVEEGVTDADEVRRVLGG